MSWGEPGKGKWVTIWTNQGHVFLEVAGIRFDTSAQRVTGSRWINEMRSTEGFVARHPAGSLDASFVRLGVSTPCRRSRCRSITGVQALRPP